MRIFFETDLEGAVGVYNGPMNFRGDPLFEYAYRELAKDINAAVDGALAGGAEVCYVSDGHGEQGLDWSLVDPRAVSCKDSLPESFDAMFMIGCHAQAGTQNAFLDHTQSSTSWFRYTVNGRPTGEIGQSAMFAAAFNAPAILVTGDEAAVTEAYNFLGEIETVAVKRGVGRAQCVMYDPEESRHRIREAAKRAAEDWIAGRKQYRLYAPALPAVCELTYMRTDFADQAMAWSKKSERVDGRTLRWVAQSYQYSEILP